MNIAHIIHAAAGTPSMQSSIDGVCRFCGHNRNGIAFPHWMRDTFVDYIYLQSGDIVCDACQFCMSESSELIASMVNKEKPQRFRNYSHIVMRDLSWRILSKAQKKEMIACIKQDPLFVIIAESGQKHLFFRVKPGFWQFEEQSIRADIKTLSYCLEWTTQAYSYGVGKNSIAALAFSSREIARCGLSFYRSFCNAMQQYKDSSIYHLAVFLTQHEGEEEHDG